MAVKLALRKRLDELVRKKNSFLALHAYPDPLQIARLQDDGGALLCALFAYGNAQNILKFLQRLDFSLLYESEKNIQKGCKGLKYRFQNERDIVEIFIALRRFLQEQNLNEFFTRYYEEQKSVVVAISAFIKKIYALNAYRSKGFEFFFLKPFEKKLSSPLKRYNLFLRWMVRNDELDLHRFKQISPKHLLVPLDTHTHKISLKLGLMERKSYDFKAVLELSKNLSKFDKKDPIKYDFALYRMGQLKEF